MWPAGWPAMCPAGWPARHCERGGGVFQLSEVWVDGVFMLEMLDPVQTAHYRKVITAANWKHLLAEMAAA